MGRSKDNGIYEVRVAKAKERNAKLVGFIHAGQNKHLHAGLHVLGPKRLATRLIAAGMLYQQK